MITTLDPSVRQVHEEECKAVQAERGSSVCTWDPSRGSWGQYATGEHVYRDSGECIVPCNPRPDRLSCEFAGDQNCAWDDCKRECVEVPERVAELNLAGKEGYMKETNCNGRGVDATWFYGGGQASEENSALLHSPRLPSSPTFFKEIVRAPLRLPPL